MSCADPKSREDASARKGGTLREFSVRMLKAALTPRKTEKNLTSYELLVQRKEILPHCSYGSDPTALTFI